MHDKYIKLPVGLEMRERIGCGKESNKNGKIKSKKCFNNINNNPFGFGANYIYEE